MRRYVLTLPLILALGLSVPAMAATPFDTLAPEIAAQGKTGKAHLKIRNLSAANVSDYAARLTAAHGAPKASRGALKVWEVPNPAPKAGDSDTITVMLGPNKNGRNVLTLDCRGVSKVNRATRAEAKSKQRARARQVARAASRIQTRAQSQPAARTSSTRRTGQPAISDID